MSESLDELSRQLMSIKNEITSVNAVVKELTAQKKDLEYRLIDALKAIGAELIRNDYGTFSISENIVPSNIDWEVFHGWILENDMLHILQRRVSAKEYRTLIELGETVPGVTPYSATTLHTKR